jgi:hypothetical protein
MAPRKPKRPDYSGSLASYKQSVADKPKNLDLPSPSDVVNWASGIVASGRTAAGQTQPLTPGDQGLRTLGQGISLANTYLNPYANTTRKALGAAVNRDRQSLTALSKSAAVDALVTGGGYGAGKAIQTGVTAAAPSIAKILAKTNLSSELAPGQNLAFHFSNNPNLKTIKDIPALRNQGGNYGSVFDSTQIAPKGSTYGYGPLQNTSGLSELEGAVNEARNSLNRATAAGQNREYTLYATKANPLVKGRTTRIKDPEYGTSKLAGDSGQSIYGKQKVIASVPLDYKPLAQLEATELALGAKASRYRVDPAYQAAQEATSKAKSEMLNQTLNELAKNPKVVRAGLTPSPLQNPFSAYQYGTPPVPRTQQQVPSVTQIIQGTVKNAGKIGAATAVVSKNKKDTKKK